MLNSIFCIWVAIKLQAPWYITLLPFLHMAIKAVTEYTREINAEILTNAILKGLEDKDE